MKNNCFFINQCVYWEMGLEWIFVGEFATEKATVDVVGLRESSFNCERRWACLVFSFFFFFQFFCCCDLFI